MTRLLSLVLFFSLIAPSSMALAVGNRSTQAIATMETFADGRTGLLVWQTRRTGPMRIFASDFDGSNVRQLTPDAAARDHLAPLISPDGSKVLYYETFILTDNTYYDDHTGDMMIIDADGSNVRKLRSNVRTYFECRFARWLDMDRIAYIGDDHDTYVYTISTDSSSKLFAYPYPKFGAIPNQQLTHAIDGKNRVFTINNAGPNGTLTEEMDYNGCEGNMSYDGQWAYRVQASNHHFTKMKLGTWEEASFFDNHNSVLPSDQNYIYFPQINVTQEFLILGASQDQHAHFTSDYDIFVVPIDPVTLSPTGDAIKYSFDTSLDTYPDIWVASSTPTFAGIQLTTPRGTIRTGDALEITALLRDTLGEPIDGPLTWSTTGGGTFDPASSTTDASRHVTLFTSDGSEGSFTITAISGSMQGSTVITVIDVVLPVQINSGSNDFDVDGWMRDDGFVSDGSDWTNSNDVDTSGVANAAPADVYKSVRHLTPHYYDLLLPDGTYTVRLHFADAYTDRTMNYFIEGEHMIVDLDPATEAGGVNRALVKELTVQISDGNGLQIEVQGPGDAFEAGIEVMAAAEEQPPVTGGPGGDENDPMTTDDLQSGTPMVGGCAAAAPSSANWFLLLLVPIIVRRRRA